MNKEQKAQSLPSASLVQNGLLAEAISVKPILFSTEMVKAILEGRKTQTRRIIKNVPKGLSEEETWMNLLGRKCPYGNNILWVREKWRKNEIPTGYPYHYYADDDIFNFKDNEKWRPSIFMPKDACRVFLKINSVTVQKLHDITEKDAQEEGVKRHIPVPGDGLTCYKNYTSPKTPFYGNNAKLSFQTLWEKINSNWDDNPWVWVINFEITERPVGFC